MSCLSSFPACGQKSLRCLGCAAGSVDGSENWHCTKVPAGGVGGGLLLL